MLGCKTGLFLHILGSARDFSRNFPHNSKFKAAQQSQSCPNILKDALPYLPPCSSSPFSHSLNSPAAAAIEAFEPRKPTGSPCCRQRGHEHRIQKPLHRQGQPEALVDEAAEAFAVESEATNLEYRSPRQRGRESSYCQQRSQRPLHQQGQPEALVDEAAEALAVDSEARNLYQAFRCGERRLNLDFRQRKRKRKRDGLARDEYSPDRRKRKKDAAGALNNYVDNNKLVDY
jgi:hypothetical protein